jgi:DNA polymerase elongation subunit (family B)
VSLPLEADERMEAFKHYFGITHTGELITRGIELRRHDTPNFIKEFQTEVLHTLFDCKNSNEVMSIGYEKALLLVTKTIDRIMTGDIQLQDLVVSKLLGQGLEKYKSLFPHVSAAIQLSKTGKSPMVGEGIEYIHIDAHHTNPLRRVKPTDLIIQGEALNYDKEKYREMLIEAAETVLGFFGFDSAIYGDTAKKKNGKWWHKFKDRSRDIENETL